MAITKEQREEIRRIQREQSQKFFKTGVATKGSLKGTINTARQVGVKRETTVDHKTIGGQTVKLNANAKAKINPKLGKAIERSNLNLVATGLSLRIVAKDISGNIVVDEQYSTTVKGNMKNAFYAVLEGIELSLNDSHFAALDQIEEFAYKANYNEFRGAVIKRNNVVYTTTWDITY